MFGRARGDGIRLDRQPHQPVHEAVEQRTQTAAAGFGKPPLLMRSSLGFPPDQDAVISPIRPRQARFQGAVIALKRGNSPQVVSVTKTDCEARDYNTPFILSSELKAFQFTLVTPKFSLCRRGRFSQLDIKGLAYTEKDFLVFSIRTRLSRVSDVLGHISQYNSPGRSLILSHVLIHAYFH
jgi:hypothetical protein